MDFGADLTDLRPHLRDFRAEPGDFPPPPTCAFGGRSERSPPPHSIPTSRYGGGTHPSAPPSLHKTPGRTGTKKAEKCIFAVPAWPCPPPPPPPYHSPGEEPRARGGRGEGEEEEGGAIKMRGMRRLPRVGEGLPVGVGRASPRGRLASPPPPLLSPPRCVRINGLTLREQ